MYISEGGKCSRGRNMKRRGKGNSKAEGPYNDVVQKAI